MADATINPDSEIWKSIPSRHRIEVSSAGRVRADTYPGGGSIAHRRIIAGELMPSGYRRVQLGGTRYYVHRLVCEGFHGPKPFDGATVDHLDGDRQNNSPENLEWVTRSENSRRQNADGRGAPKGEAHPLAKLTNYQAESIFRLHHQGWKPSEIARLFSVSVSLIYKILTGEKRFHASASFSTSSTLRSQPLPNVAKVDSER